MFFHNFKYAMKSIFRNKTMLIWTIIFPLALGTFMYMAFGQMNEKDMVFHTINVSVVEEEKNESFEDLLEELSKADGDDIPLLKVTKSNKEDALAALAKGDTDAVIYEGKDISLTVQKSDIPQEIVRSIVEQYNKSIELLEDVAKKDPTKIQEVVDTISDSSKEYTTELTTSNSKQDGYANFFYAIIGMSCMFAAYGACEMGEKMTVTTSEIGKRRSVAYSSKGTQAIAYSLALWICQSVIEVVTIFYLKTLGVTFGDNFLYMIPVAILGSAVGIAIGTLVGSIPGMNQGLKAGLCTALGMGFSIMADLCSVGIKDSIEHSLPILNRLNPAVLIADSFYALTVFDTYDRYIRNLVILAIMAVVLFGISFMLLRRDRSANL